MGPIEAGTPNCIEVYGGGVIGQEWTITFYADTHWSANCQARWKAAHRRCNQPNS